MGKAVVPVAGVDGCRSGWVVATVRDDEDAPQLTVVEAFAEVARAVATGRLAHVAVDMPIGLSASGPRRCDVAARRLLGPRRSSVYPAPVRSVLGARSYAEALERSRAASGRGLSKQTYNILARISEVDDVVREAGQRRITETHPELAFAVLLGAPCPWPKRSAPGLAARWRALRGVFPGLARDVPRPPGAKPDDVADACALAWSARRLHRGEAVRLDGGTDDTGLVMEIAY